MRCAKHGVETEVSCGRCSTPVCPKCMVHTDVGVRCKNCAGDHRGREVGNTSRVVVIGALALGAIVAIGTVGGGVFGGGSSNSVPDVGDYSQYLGETSVQQVADPWVPDDGSKPRDGYRFVAVELLHKNNTSGDIPVFADAQMFTLTDKDRFVYAPVPTGGARPRLPPVQLDVGKKARGWVTFEIPRNAEVDSLSDFAQRDIPLP